jgi:hypothetical protein
LWCKQVKTGANRYKRCKQVQTSANVSVANRCKQTPFLQCSWAHDLLVSACPLVVARLRLCATAMHHFLVRDASSRPQHCPVRVCEVLVAAAGAFALSFLWFWEARCSRHLFRPPWPTDAYFGPAFADQHSHAPLGAHARTCNTP